jgi:hypothetical protein
MRGALPQWGQQRQTTFNANPIAVHNPFRELFATVPDHNYVELYPGVGFGIRATLGLWFLRINRSVVPTLSLLLRAPEQHWGWDAHVKHFDLSEVAPASTGVRT